MQDGLGWAGVLVSLLEQLPHITHPVKHPKNDYVIWLLTVVDHVPANRSGQRWGPAAALTARRSADSNVVPHREASRSNKR